MLLEIKNLYFSYSSEKPLFTNFNLTVPHGKVIAIAGESGCGKSTLLNLIYGLLDRDHGEVIFDGRLIFGPKRNLVPGESEMKLVAQNYDLLPYATVAENVGKFISNIDQKGKRQRVAELISVVGLEDFAQVLPKNLSGGQQQRVALARALSVLPKLLLLDEPFSNLDFSRRIQLRERLFRYVREKGISLLISTHEIPEIMPWLDQIVVLREGRLIQRDTAAVTFRQPYNAYVAALFGEINIFTEEEKFLWNLPKKIWYTHEIRECDQGTEATVEESLFAGNHYRNRIRWNGKELIAFSPKKWTDKVKISFVPSTAAV